MQNAQRLVDQIEQARVRSEMNGRVGDNCRTRMRGAQQVRVETPMPNYSRWGEMMSPGRTTE